MVMLDLPIFRRIKRTLMRSVSFVCGSTLLMTITNIASILMAVGVLLVAVKASQGNVTATLLGVIVGLIIIAVFRPWSPGFGRLR